MHLFDKLPFLKSDQADEVEPVLSEEDLRAERIAFHRNKVRNGPVKFSVQTSGQVRREQVRALSRKTKNARRRQIREHFATKSEIAILRSHLQAAGIILYSTDYRPGDGDVINAFTWIIARFADKNAADEHGRIEVTEGVVRASLQAALNRYQHLTNRPQTKLSDEYVLPIGVAA